jgi:hypothetical protein
MYVYLPLAVLWIWVAACGVFRPPPVVVTWPCLRRRDSESPRECVAIIDAKQLVDRGDSVPLHFSSGCGADLVTPRSASIERRSVHGLATAASRAELPV